MNTFVIWIDREHAKIFQISPEIFEKKTFVAKQSEHHTYRLDSFDHQRQEHKLFEQSATYMRNADKVLIVGPGISKFHFQTYLMEHFPAIARKIAACEVVDHPSDAEIAAYARKYFEVSGLTTSTHV